MKYLSKKQRHIPEGHSNWLSALTCFLLTLTPALGMIAAAESLGPENGILVTILPQLNRDQVRLVTKATNKPPETELDASNSGDHDAAALLPRDSSDSTVTDAPSISTSEPLQEIDSAAITEPSDTSDDEASSKAPKAVAILKTTESATESSQEDSETQQTPQPRETVPSADEEIPKSTDSNSKAKSQGVLAEGVGTTPDEAIKDAFRNAVRQVVGAVVDAETLVKNDEIIDDKVLTYSDGFIKGYEEVVGSKKVKGGLHRIKIKAQVERRSVIAKLRAANVIVKGVDGKGLFAEAVTQLDAEMDAAALLKKQFEGFPQSCITATIIGKPEIVEKSTDKATVKFTILIEPDLNAYKSFSGKLILILDKLAKDKGEFTAVFESQMTQDNSFTYFFPKQPGDSCEIMADWMPKSFSGVRRTPQLKSDFTTLALTTQRSKASDRLECRYYRIDKSLRPLLADIRYRKGSGKLSLLGTNNEEVITDRFSLSERVPWNTDTYEGTLIASAGHIYGEYFYMLGRENDRDERKKEAFLFWIGPVFLLPNTNRIHHKPSIKVTRILPLSLDELKSVKDVKVEITFDE